MAGAAGAKREVQRERERESKLTDSGGGMKGRKRRKRRKRRKGKR